MKRFDENCDELKGVLKGELKVVNHIVNCVKENQLNRVPIYVVYNFVNCSFWLHYDLLFCMFRYIYTLRYHQSHLIKDL